MKYYQHDFDSIEDYLHHRSPYLLVERIVEMGDQGVITEATVRGDDFYIAGHFPGAPILPGAMMQEMATQTAGILIAAKYNPMEEFNTHDPLFNEWALGVLTKANWARYRGFARPGDMLRISVELNEQIGAMFDFSAVISVGKTKIMQNSFRLANILSKTLQGEA